MAKYAEQEQGTELLRGKRRIEVEHAPEAFTVVLPSWPEADQLRDAIADDVRPLTPSGLTPTIARVGVPRDALEGAMETVREQIGFVAHHEYAGPAGSRYATTDELHVSFAPDTSADQQQTILAAAGVRVKKRYRQLPGTYLVSVTDDAGGNPLKVARKLNDEADVVYAEPAIVNRLASTTRPIDDQLPWEWHLDSALFESADLDPAAGAFVRDAWSVTKGSRAITVAVLDDGFDLGHPDFQGEGKIVHPVDFRGGDDSPFPDAGDFHGTPCAGVAIAEENGSGCVGAAPGCSFMPVRIPNGLSDAWLIEIFAFVSARAHVASCSWTAKPGFYPLSAALYDTIQRAARVGGKDGRGLLIVFAAGNDGAPLRTDDEEFELEFRERDLQGRWQRRTINGPIFNGFGAHPEVVTVSASTSLRTRARYSNRGEQVAVAAPSNDFDPLTGRRLRGLGITTTDNEYFGSDFEPGKRYTNSFGGTSASCPLVAGIAALVKSVNPGLTARAIKQLLVSEADPLDGDAGAGKVNAGRAVTAAAQTIVGELWVSLTNAQAVKVIEEMIDDKHFRRRVLADPVRMLALRGLSVAAHSPPGGQIPDVDELKRILQLVREEERIGGPHVRRVYNTNLGCPQPGESPHWP